MTFHVKSAFTRPVKFFENVPSEDASVTMTVEPGLLFSCTLPKRAARDGALCSTAPLDRPDAKQRSVPHDRDGAARARATSAVKRRADRMMSREG